MACTSSTVYVALSPYFATSFRNRSPTFGFSLRSTLKCNRTSSRGMVRLSPLAASLRKRMAAMAETEMNKRDFRLFMLVSVWDPAAIIYVTGERLGGFIAGNIAGIKFLPGWEIPLFIDIRPQ